MSEWLRVSRYHPCIICDHIDWCTYLDDGSGSCCMRVESNRHMHNGGYFHALSSPVRSAELSSSPFRTPVLHAIPIHFTDIISRWRSSGHEKLESYGALLGVSKESLDWLNVCWSPENRAWAFPMCSPAGEITGIRLRGDHHKWSVKGSKNGLFFSFDAAKKLSLDTILITEGPSDTCAGLSLGFFAIGRPACRGCEEMVAAVLRQLQIQEVIVCMDNDEPGVKGAEELIKFLRRPVRRFVPPCKDLREFLTKGGTKDLLLSCTSSTIRR